jgi:hypothetical protein
MTFGSARVSTEPRPLTWTRFHPQAPKIAATVASRILPYLLAQGRPLFEPGLRLLLKLGFAGRLLSQALRKLIAINLLRVSAVRLSAAVVLARVYSPDLDNAERELLHRNLLAGPAADPGDATTRRSLGLVWLGEELPSGEAFEVVDNLAAACTRPLIA